jgi:hypothetical protein
MKNNSMFGCFFKFHLVVAVEESIVTQVSEGIAGVGFGPEEHMSGLTFRSSPGFDLGTRGF